MIAPALRAAGRIVGTAGLAASACARGDLAGRGATEVEARRARVALLADAARATLALHGLALRTAGPPPPPGALLVSNHRSYLDPLAVAGAAPCLPISKADLAAWPVLGRAARALGVLFLARGDPRSGMRLMRAARRALEAGISVLNFPEGTTTAGDLLAFRRGLFGVALRAGAPVVPVAIAYDPPELAWTGDATFLPHYLAVAARAGASVRLAFGAPVAAAGFSRAQDLARAVHGEIARLLGPDLSPRPAASGEGFDAVPASSLGAPHAAAARR